jgi:hypothetical protein
MVLTNTTAALARANGISNLKVNDQIISEILARILSVVKLILT